jgi:chromosome segregation ATPase
MSYDTLLLKMRTIEQEKNDLLILNHTLESNYNHKYERVEELTKEVSRLKSLLTCKKDEYDAYQSKSVMEMAQIEAQLVEKEYTIENIKDLLIRNEVRMKELESICEDRYDTIIQLEDEIGQLKDLIEKLNEMQSTTDEMLHEYKTQDGNYGNEIIQMKNILSQKIDIIQKLNVEITYWKDKTAQLEGKNNNDNIDNRSEERETEKMLLSKTSEVSVYIL